MDVDFIERLIRFYKEYSPWAGDGMSAIWKPVFDRYQVKMHQAFQAGDAQEIIRLFETYDEQGMSWGIGGCTTDMQYKMLLTDLAFHTGILPIFNPEQPSLKSADFECIRESIQQFLGFKLETPDYFDFRSHGGASGLPYSFLRTVAAAISIRRRLRGKVPNHILEIGPGLGHLGLIAHRWKVKTYSVIDLPLMAVTCAYCLAKTCGEDKIWLDGEPVQEGKFCYIYPSTDYHPASLKYDVIFNMDSLPEIPNDVQDIYINLIANHLTPDGFFMSINHESDVSGQRRVFLAAEANGRLELVSRAPWFMRGGYVEEVYVKA